MTLSASEHTPSPQSDALSAVAALRATIWDCGYRPIAVYNWDSDHPSPGKAPKGNAWQERARKNPPDAASRAAELDALNTGILCDGLRAIDVDVEDKDAAFTIKAKAVEAFGETLIRYRANTSRVLLLYRATEGEPEKRFVIGKKGKVEVLGRGQQFVAFGKHPTGFPLEWMPESPAEFQSSDLPAITEEQVGKLLEFSAKVIEGKPENYRSGTGATSARGLLAADALQVIAAVCAIPNEGPPDWESWNRLGMALWAATGGSAAGLAAWHAWSQQHPSYDRQHTQDRWDHYFVSPPTSIGAGAIFHMAKQHTREVDDTAAQAPQEPPPEPTLTRISILRSGWIEADIPARPWLARGYLLRGSLTALAGHGSAGKSSLVVAWSTAHSLGRSFGRFNRIVLPTGQPSDGPPRRVVFYNVEDDQDEQKRRYSAMARQFGVETHDIMKNLAIVSPNDVGTLLRKNRDGGLFVDTDAMAELKDFCEAWGAEVLWMDPFVELHTAEENDNTAVREVLANFRAYAKQKQIACGILFHNRKGVSRPDDPDQVRGASAIIGACRVTLNVSTMTEEEAENLDVMKDHRRDYFRVDDAKKNYSRIEDAEWFERIEYELDNGDGVAVPYPWAPKNITPTTAIVSQAVEMIAKGTPLGPYSPRLSDDPRSIRHVLARAGVNGAQAQKGAIDLLLKSGEVEIGLFRKAGKASSEPAKGFRTRAGEPRAALWVDAPGVENGR